MAVVDPQSTAFQRSEAWRLLVEQQRIAWSQQWVDYERISVHLKRAVIASEDAASPTTPASTGTPSKEPGSATSAWRRRQQARPQATVKIVGGSTITQQLAKNLLLSGERTVLRKGQEFVLTLMLEALLSKQRILEIYLNNVEWGEGCSGRRRRRGTTSASTPRNSAPCRRRGWPSCCRRPSASRSGRARPTSRAARRPSSRAWGRWRCHERPGACALEIDDMSLSEEIAAAAARLVVEDGMEYGQAKRRAARDLGRRAVRGAELPGNEAVEDAVREYLDLFCADTQPAELRALREVAAAVDAAAGRVPPAPGRRRLARHRHAALCPAPGPVLRRLEERRAGAGQPGHPLRRGRGGTRRPQHRRADGLVLQPRARRAGDAAPAGARPRRPARRTAARRPRAQLARRPGGAAPAAGRRQRGGWGGTP
jgi:hypothetical protein